MVRKSMLYSLYTDTIISWYIGIGCVMLSVETILRYVQINVTHIEFLIVHVIYLKFSDH